VPWYAKALAVGVVGYALSPIDLIPDFIPVLGSLDDLILVPLGVVLVRRLIPPDVWADCRERARAGLQGGGSSHRVAAAVIVTIWILTALAFGWLVFRPAR
jgi:uncharacterized membrane protein YkvA (DUF1232 family)